MWETFISWYINTYLGKYVENLNSQQLSFALGQGELELENVPLKKNIFRSWGLPVEVKASVVGRIKIEFNLFKYLRNEPVLITIEDVYVVAGALNLSEWDPVEEELLAHDAKMDSLDSHEARWKAQFDISSTDSSYYSSLYFSSMRIGASIVTKVVENLQLNVRNVHIRFEEAGSSPGRVIAFGVTLDGLTVQSCDSTWNALSSSVGNASECSFKTLQLSKFGVYCDTRGEPYSTFGPDELKAAMSKVLALNHEYLLCPVSAEARIAKNNSPSSLSSSSKPRFDVHLVLDKVPLQLTDSQYKNTLRTYRSFMRLQRHCRLRHYRPYGPVAGNVSEWWGYAFRAVLTLKGYKRRRQLKTMEEVLQRARDNVAYVKAYEQHLIGDLVSLEARQVKDRVEQELHYDEILELREIVMLRMERRGGCHNGGMSTSTSTAQMKKESSSASLALVPLDPNNSSQNKLPPQQTPSRYGIMSWVFPSWSAAPQPEVPMSPSLSDMQLVPVNAMEHSASSPQLALPSSETNMLSPSVRGSESDFDEAIMGDVKAFGRDALLARFNFKLDKGTVSLLRKSLPFLEFDFTGVQVEASLKPRSGSHKFQMTLSTVSLKDCRTKQLIVTPHHNIGSSGKIPSYNAPSSLRPNSSTSSASSNKEGGSSSSRESLFSLTYEKKPHKKAAHKIVMTSRPLDLILSPEFYEDVVKFFRVRDIDEDLIFHQSQYEIMKQKTKEELRIYWERLVDQHASTNTPGISNWEIYLDISAPQIIIFGNKPPTDRERGRQQPPTGRHPPAQRLSSGGSSRGGPSSTSSSSSSGGSFVVIDLGRFRFTNVRSEDGINSPEPSISTKENETENSLSDNEDDEEFLTPCSSPLPGDTIAESSVTSPGASIIGNADYLNRRFSLDNNIQTQYSNGGIGETIDTFYSKLYKNYSLEITDIHVIVVDARSSRDVNWRAASCKNTSGMHLIDKFSVDVQLERRLVYSEDPMWPALTVIATLPKLTFHVNESKVNTVRGVIGAYFSTRREDSLSDRKSESSFSLNQSLTNLNEEMLQDTSYSTSTPSGTLPRNHAGHSKSESGTGATEPPPVKANSRLVVAQFTVQHVSVDIQSRDRNIAELQILGARTVLSQRSGNTEITFVIQSLLLADAVQTFGPDFQLLLASHKHVCMDTVSGSLRDSEPTSPMSPQPPASPLPQTAQQRMAQSLTMPSQLHEALLASLRSKWRKQNINAAMDNDTPLLETDALITADLTLTSKDEDMAILHVQFNNLDVIANQETWVEIFQFIQKLTPRSSSVPEEEDHNKPEEENENENSNQRPSQKLQANFEFRRLNVLLLRGVVGKDGDECARKIATATASDSKINLVLNKGLLTVDGSLGGLQMLNLTPEGQYHQRVLSVGQDPLVDPTYQPFVLGEDLSSSNNGNSAVESALTFNYERNVNKHLNLAAPPKLVLRMASVIYTHCPIFLVDLKKCISQFQEPLTTKLKSAAAQIALGLVRQDAIPGLNFRSSSNSLSGSLERLDFDESCHQFGPGASTSGGADHFLNYNDIPGRTPKSSLKLDVVLDSPVIVLPRNRNSAEVLVANLGQISVVGNNQLGDPQEINGDHMDAFEYLGDLDSPCNHHQDAVSYNIFVCDISLYSLNLRDRWRMVDSLKMTYPSASSTTLMRAQELYQCDHASAIPILHNTVIHLTISYMDDYITTPPGSGGDPSATGDLNGGGGGSVTSSSQLHIQGRVISALKVSLTPKQYAQVLDSLGNIATNEDDLETNEVSVTERRVNWQKEVGHLRTGGGRVMKEPLPLPSPTHYADDSLPIKSSFEISELIVELALPVQTQTPVASSSTSASAGVDTPHLTLSCSELSYKCDKRSHRMEMDVCLKALKLEDTSVSIDSPRRVLASSKPGGESSKPMSNKSNKKSKNIPPYVFSQQQHFHLSKSCPDLQKSTPVTIAESPSVSQVSGIRGESSSLPDELDPGMIFSGRYHPVGIAFKPLKPIRKRRTSTKRTKGSSQTIKQFCPVTPPPSPRPEDQFWDNLVHIKIIFIDPKSPDFITKYEGMHKHTRVDFNILEVLLIPETFACLRQFFSDASKHGGHTNPVPPPPQQTPYYPHHLNQPQPPVEPMDFHHKNTETVINVRALMVKLARTSGELAEAEVNNVHCELKSIGMNWFGVSGTLGSLEIRDISPFAGLYPLKFVFQGEQALDFDYVRESCDAKFRLKMSSIVCVHTNRFYTEFTHLWSSLFGSAAKEVETPLSETATSAAGQSSSQDSSTEAPVKVTLDIQAGAPVIILPYSAMSEKLLIVDLGHLAVKNKFIEEAPDMVLNITSIDLIAMDLYSGDLVSQWNMEDKVWKLQQGTAIVKSQGNPSFLKKKCALNLKMRRYFVGQTPESQALTFLHGTLSTVHCTVNSEKFRLVRGLLQYNIGEPLEPLEEVVLPYNRHSSRQNIQSRLELGIELELVNVILEVLKDEDYQLSRIDFLKSKFTFQSNSDGTKDVDLASQEILICDIRLEPDKNCFKNILQQSGTYYGGGGSSASGPSSLSSNASMSGHSSFQGKVPLQAEIHYRQSQRGTNVTIVLNNMRLMLILDWWMEVLEFIFQKIHPPKPHPHQEEDEKEKSKHGSRHRTISPLLERSKEMATTAITVSAGIVTKRAPVLVIPESTFELKMNVSSCELVLVEDPAVWDSNAIILKSTAMLGYRPHLERPISCSLLECELFSCILGLESETALSILDPTNIQIELVRQAYSESQGILDATLGVSSSAKILKVQSPNLSLRLSYYDMKMFFKFLERFSKEAKRNLQKRKSSGEQQAASSMDVQDSEMASTSERNLGQYGFSFVEFGEDALATLDKNEAELEYGDYGEGGASSPSNLVIPSQEGSGGSVSPAGQESSTLCGIEVKCNFLSLCVIDDCRDADVPLLEVGVQTLELSQNCVENCGTAECVLTGDYYNRALSGWEPFLEPWKCTIAWQKNLIGKLGEHSPSNEFPSKAPELELSIFSKKILDLNITSTLLTLYRTVSSNWSEDYQQQKSDKRRAPFVPFALRNETGSALWFRTILSENDGVTVRERVVGGGSKPGSADSGDFVQDATGWIQVNHLAVQPFSFEGRVKLRHRNTHQIRTHQLALKVDGWQEVTPVSVDKVGTYFRIANPMVQRRLGLYTELPPTRLVFEVSLEGAAQKLVTVRSALQVKNSLPDPVELKLENTIVYPSFERAQTGGSYIAKIQPGKTYPIPLHSVWAHMWIRPLIPDGALISQYSYCTKALLVTSQDNQMSGLRECTSVTSEELQCYRFCVAVQRDDFPADDDQIIPPNTAPSIVQLMSISKRANLITLKSPFRISNLLPHEITFEIRSKGISGHIASGKDYDMTNVDTSEAFEIIFTTETFSQTAPLNVSPSVNGIAARIKMVDAQKRIVFMTARVRRGEGGTVTIALSCPVWIINKSGLPIVCKQEGTSSEAAGQFKEHEVGRMVTPLLFSFADQETSEAITLRVGNGLHKDSKPYWCRAFLCQNGTRVRKLAVSHSNNRPESVYMVGVEVKSGSGRYRDTKLVVISPRFVVDNRSPRRVQISQRVYATSFYDAAAQATHLTLTPDCNLPFHWPRLDRDQLLCIKLVDIDNGLWSGGFPIDNVDSFHVNIRDRDGNSTFLRVEIVLQGSTYFIVLNGTEQLPPPFRIDNLGFVPVTFHQACVGEERLKLTAKAESSLAYALDEPTQPAHLTLEAPGGQSVIVNMDVLGSASLITYENFFYIALTATFPPEEEENVIVGVGMESLNLVLEVTPGNTKVTLAKKEPGKLSQLWRVNSDGLIEHEGSRPLGEPTKQSEPGAPKWVLDIAGSAPQPSQCVALTLRRPEKRRASTQHWEFTSDGRLKLSMYANMYVQAKDGFGLGGVSYEADSQEANGASWKLWSDVVLGPPQPVCYIRTASGIPAEQAISRQKLRGGSGQLNLEVLTDGPTRVVRICDEVIPPRIHLFRHTFEASNCNTAPKFKVKVDLKSGLGISVVSCYPREELVYCKLSGMMLEWTESKESQIVKAAVENLQIDNQLHESEKSVVMYVTASERFETVEDLSAYEPAPALRLSWESMKSKLNAHVFKYWELEVKPLNVILEERLLLKVCNWMGVGQNTQQFDGLRESDFEVQKAFTNTTSLTAKRFYFGMLKILLNQVRLSVLTSSKLPPELAMVKRRLGLTLIRFEDAIVDLDTFIKYHPFETFEFLLAMVVKHYRDELMSQAAVILGSTDFLGNPLGFVNDVSVGVSGLIYEGSVFSLVRNVTHGISNSAAKVTGSLGEALGGRTILDDKHEEERRKIKEEHSGDSAQHLYAGLKGFGHGFIGGITSIATQSYEGLSTDGMSGLITGIGKGIIGTVTKPAVGVLDLAAGAAYAIRDSSQTSSRMIPPRVRPTRVVVGTGGLLPSYSETSARGQELLYDINDRNYKELFIGYETLKSGVNQDFKIMIASEAIIVFKPGKGYTQLLRIPLSDLIECRIAELNERGYENSPYIEFVSQVRDAAAAGQCIRPQVVCESDQVAKRVVQQVNYAKVLYEELRHSQKENPNSNNDD